MLTVSTTLLVFMGVIALLIIAVLFILYFNAREQLTQLIVSFQKLKKSFIELDEQAKLIVRTDLELNKAQEELDRRLGSLDALQKASRLISTTLDEKEIFQRLDQSLFTNLGFEKNLICLYTENRNLQTRVGLGFQPEEIGKIFGQLKDETDLKRELAEGRTISSVNAPKRRKESLSRLFDVDHFVISPILSQDDILGFVFVGNRSNASPITEGDEELISILANQIGQSLENARYFEESIRSGQTLEIKVRDRTKELASALEEVKKVSKTKSEFISAVSHELRTPLTSIKGYASILMTGKLGDIPEPVRERLSKINTHSDNLVKLINDLLDISRIEAGRQELTMEKCDPLKMAENVHDLLTPQLNSKNIQWSLKMPVNLPTIQADRSQIERAFINLIGNAIKFTPVNGTISVSAKTDNSVIEFSVSDTGIGISEEDIYQIFNEFYRVENKINEEVKGTGLGLTLTKKIIEAHHGKIWVTSKINKGTTFHFTLPLTPAGESKEKDTENKSGASL